MEWSSHESIRVDDAQGDGQSYGSLIVRVNVGVSESVNKKTRPIREFGIAYRMKCKAR